MANIKISAGSNDLAGLLTRQTPSRSSSWGGNKFYVNSTIDECDYWIVCHESGIQKVESALCPPENIIYISMEPSEDVCRVNNSFLKQFHTVITCDTARNIPQRLMMNVSTWWVGLRMQSINNLHVIDKEFLLDYDSLSINRKIEKKNRISVVVSNKKILNGHRQRLIAIEKIMSRPIGRYIDLYGTGFNPILDKYDVISPYKYHLIFENVIQKNYWSEKLGDSYLGAAFPIYSGCPNISDYFNSKSFLEINRFNIDDIENKIEFALTNHLYEKNYDAILDSKDRILNKYNIFNIISDICINKEIGKKKKVTIYPNEYFGKKLVNKTYWKMKYLKSKIAP